MSAFKGETLGGLTAPLTFTKGKPTPNACFFVYEVRNGSYIRPDGTTPTCETWAALAD